MQFLSLTNLLNYGIRNVPYTGPVRRFYSPFGALEYNLAMRAGEYTAVFGLRSYNRRN